MLGLRLWRLVLDLVVTAPAFPLQLRPALRCCWLDEAKSNKFVWGIGKKSAYLTHVCLYQLQLLHPYKIFWFRPATSLLHMYVFARALHCCCLRSTPTWPTSWQAWPTSQMCWRWRSTSRQSGGHETAAGPSGQCSQEMHPGATQQQQQQQRRRRRVAAMAAQQQQPRLASAARMKMRLLS